MDISELTKEEQERLGSLKSSITYYLYLLKYRHYSNGIFAFDSFCKDASNYATLLNNVDQTVQIEILSVEDFLAIERIFWRLMEELFAENQNWGLKKSFDPNRRIEATANLRDWYIAYHEKKLIACRFFWSFPIEETRKRIISDIRSDVMSVNSIDGVTKISMDFINEEISNITNARNFEELETTLEEVSGRIWDCIQPITDTLLNELEKADCRRTPAYPYEGYGARLPSSFDAFRREGIWELTWLLEGLADNGNESAIKYLRNVGHPNFPMPAENKKAQVKAKTKQTTRENDVLDFYDR